MVTDGFAAAQLWLTSLRIFPTFSFFQVISDGSMIPDKVADGVAVQTLMDGGTTDGNKEGLEKEEGHQWSDGAICALLDSYKTRWNLSMRGNLKKAQWDQIAVDVTSRSNGAKSYKTRGQCKSKMEKLKRKFRDEKDIQEKTGKVTCRWPYFSQMDVILGGGPKLSGIPGSFHVGRPSCVDKRWFSGCIPPFNRVCIDIGNGVDNCQDDFQDLPLHLNGKVVADEGQDDDASCTTPKKRQKTTAVNGDKFTEKEAGGSGKPGSKRRQMSGDGDMAAAVKSFSETIFKIEQCKMENQKDADRMRVEMELKRTEMLMNAQMQIAKIFCDSFKQKAKKKKNATAQNPVTTD
ncbi:hypothetical protein O6H91_06G070100 [Diphasiastrum complanatum]|uniref:Uncharacterized protein n=2 Tax=Diphasiastrum complanatum TaxID=34168 RepID=A0ACC2DES2_DIPCM|nr:hypothetical protein O6H91_06G070100 [Diphasiastrum complanatum]KAJ7552780.1 hypothetical protein O6H91_06G070100 [Diphasiastrum complanatum]